jgi:parallel beta-helix repeat protein
MLRPQSQSHFCATARIAAAFVLFSQVFIMSPDRAQASNDIDPTGAADSTAALQAALDAASGKSFELPKGSYTITSLTLPKDGIKISAAGARLILSDKNSHDGEPIIRIPPGSKDIQIEGLEIDGRSNVLTQFKRTSGVVSGGHTSNVVLKNLYIHDIPHSAVQIFDADTHWELGGNRIERTGRHGIVVAYVTEQVHDLYIHDNHVDYCALSPIGIIAANGDGGIGDPASKASAGAENVKISRNEVTHNGMGISGYTPNNKNILVTENKIEDTGILGGIGHASHWAGSNIVITKNFAHNTAISAIVISGWPNSNPTPVAGFTVSDNVVENVLSGRNAKGILVQNASSGKITGNKVSGTRECPIDVTGNALGHGGPRVHDVAITGNIITDSPNVGERGICVSDADNITVKDNSFR